MSNSLLGLPIGGTFRRFLQVPPAGADGTLRVVHDGEGDPLPLRLSTSAVEVTAAPTTADAVVPRAYVDAQIATRAPINSPTFAGTVTIPAGTLNNVNIGATTPGPIAVTRLRNRADGENTNIALANAPIGSVDMQFIRARMRMTGEPSARDTTYPVSGSNVFQVVDAANIPRTVTNQHVGLMVTYSVNRPSDGFPQQAARIGFQSRMFVVSQVAQDNRSGLIAIHAESILTASQGGVGNWDGIVNPSEAFNGGIMGAWVTSRAASNATNLRACTGMEINVQLDNTATAYHRTGLLIVEKFSTSQGIGEDNAIAVGATLDDDPDSVTGWRCGLSLGVNWGAWPFSANASLIKAQPRLYGPATPAICARGIDFRGVTFTTAAFESAGFVLAGNGDVTARRLTLTDLPTSAAGLSAGDLWNDSGTVKVA